VGIKALRREVGEGKRKKDGVLLQNANSDKMALREVISENPKMRQIFFYRAYISVEIILRTNNTLLYRT